MSGKKLLTLNFGQFTLLECVELDALREQTLNLTITLTKLDNAVKTATEKMDGFDGLTASEVSALAQLRSRSQVSGIRYQVSGIRYQQYG